MGLDPCEAKSKGKGSWQGQGQGHGQRKLWLSSDTLRGDCTQQCGRLEGWFWTSVPTLIERATTPSAQLTREGIRDNARYQQWGSRVAARLVQTWRIPPYGPTAQFGARRSGARGAGPTISGYPSGLRKKGIIVILMVIVWEGICLSSGAWNRMSPGAPWTLGHILWGA